MSSKELVSATLSNKLNNNTKYQLKCNGITICYILENTIQERKIIQKVEICYWNTIKNGKEVLQEFMNIS